MEMTQNTQRKNSWDAYNVRKHDNRGNKKKQLLKRQGRHTEDYI